MPTFRNALFASLLSSGAADAHALSHPLGSQYPDLDPPSLQDGDQLILDALVRDTHALLDGQGLAAVVTARVKSPASVHAKMRRKGVGYDEIFDRLALRIRVGEVDDCYAVRTLIEARHAPLSTERDDYIANPKANGYQSLHTAVRTPLGEIAEFQIRTHEMHDRAERGPAAHAQYKLTA